MRLDLMQAYRRKAIRAAALTAGFVALTGMALSGATLRGQAGAGTVRMVADLSDKILYVYEADTVAKMYDISDGKDPYPTPRGTFKVRKLNWNPSWRPPDSEWAKQKTAKGPGEKGNPMKVVKIFFKEPDYYIHGTADIGSLGSADSHGCLRMSPEDVTELGKWVLEHGGEWKGENWFMRILHSRRQEKVIFLSNPVSLSIVE
jgi:lipoprotein-anchoring transpeptidase ErfK/SrfK